MASRSSHSSTPEPRPTRLDARPAGAYVDAFGREDQDALRRCLERSLPELLGETSTLEAVTTEPFEAKTSYDTHLVTVKLSKGSDLRLFLKDFGFSLRPKNEPKLRREREVAVYRDLLPDAGLGTPRYCGSLMDEAAGRLWLLLEYVQGTPVGYTELGEGWAPAAEGLGRMHGHFARDPERLRGLDCLIHHDAELFWTTAEKALTDVAQLAPHLLGRVKELFGRYEPVVERMLADPPTLVQGGCRSSNILIHVAGDPSRVCILDWEEASFGAPLFDVAHLLDGIESPLLDRLLEAYRRGAAAEGMSLPPLDDVKYAMHCFRLHMAFNSLSRSALKGYDERGISNLVDYAEDVGRALFG